MKIIKDKIKMGFINKQNGTKTVYSSYLENGMPIKVTERYFSGGDFYYYELLVENKIAGMITVNNYNDKKIIKGRYIEDFMIFNNFRKKGFANFLLQFIVNYYHNDTLWLYADSSDKKYFPNYQLYKFYENNGFQRIINFQTHYALFVRNDNRIINENFCAECKCKKYCQYKDGKCLERNYENL